MLYLLLLQSASLVGVSVLSVLALPRLTNLNSKTPLYKWLVVIALCAAWVFACIASLLSLVPADEDICLAAVVLCATLYGATKFVVYLFLVERLHLIATSSKGPRHKNPVYIVSLFLLLPFLAIVVLLVVYRVDDVKDGMCHIGLLREGAIPLVTYDTFFGLFQTTLFASIMYRYIYSTGRNNDTQTAILRKALKVAFLGSFVAFLISSLNIFTLVVKEDLHSHLCLFICVVDVVGNALIITYLVRPISAPTSLCSKVAVAGKPLCKNVPLANGNAVGSQINQPSEEEYEHELQTVAEMLMHMQEQGRHRETTTRSATTNTGNEPSSYAAADSRLTELCTS